ncbi:MAG: glycoside hydrolase family 99-like domain-containing protein [Bacteroidales bacterium]|nr:glycoside hydrolase family 99-like domain-containing protein [Bacteroidales bacterium]
MKKLRFISIYLPQFHPIPENDQAWGTGFTEWTNVKKSRPLFRGHHQPNKPHESIGYYDLRDPEVMGMQAELAKSFGLHGFAFYHYWFNGKRLLELPVNNMLKTGKPDFPFYLIWANETWSRRWLGEEKEIIVKQTYSEPDNIHHMHWLMTVFSDPRYIRINNRPVFVIYRPFDIPKLEKFVEIFKSECSKNNVNEPYLIASNSNTGMEDPRKFGFDGILNFEPQLGVLPYILEDKRLLAKFVNNLSQGIISNKLKIYNYSTAKEQMGSREFPYPCFPCSFVNWDNSPRRNNNGIIIKNSTPQLFAKYLQASIEKFKTMDLCEEENLVMINAWNEWAEGNYLEPDERWGYSYLEAMRDVIKKPLINE